MKQYFFTDHQEAVKIVLRTRIQVPFRVMSGDFGGNHDLYFVRDLIKPKYHGETLNESHRPPKLTE